uniref:Gag-pol polyprotein n=1 Tax=Solanum tuberosum TaxID=4113 RepID=M1DK61_SOLTU
MEPDMTTQRPFARKNKRENESQSAPPQALVDPLAEEVVVPLNPNVGTVASRVGDFTRMNPLEFYDSKVEKDPQKFIDEVYKVLAIMGVTPVEHKQLAAYQLKCVAQIWFNQWKEARPSGGLGRSRFLQKFYGQGSSNAPPRFNNERMSNPRPQGGNGDSHRRAQPYPSSSPSGSSSNTPKQNRLYALKIRGEQEGSPDVVTGMLKVFQLNVYALLDPGATLYFVTPYVAMRFDVLPDVLLDPFFVSTPVGDSVVAKRVYIRYPVSLSHRVTIVDFVDLDMLDFYVILAMDWLCHARNRGHNWYSIPY